MESRGGEELRVEIKVAPTGVGQDVRQPGSDVAKGQLLLPKGALIGPAEIGLLASQVRSSVDRPRVIDDLKIV